MRNVPFGYSSRSHCSNRRAIDRLSPWMRPRRRRKFPRIINHYQERRGGCIPMGEQWEAKQEQCFAIGKYVLLRLIVNITIVNSYIIIFFRLKNIHHKNISSSNSNNDNNHFLAPTISQHFERRGGGLQKSDFRGQR